MTCKIHGVEGFCQSIERVIHAGHLDQNEPPWDYGNGEQDDKKPMVCRTGCQTSEKE